VYDTESNAVLSVVIADERSVDVSGSAIVAEAKVIGMLIVVDMTKIVNKLFQLCVKSKYSSNKNNRFVD
jgi:hypothetical protein